MIVSLGKIRLPKPLVHALVGVVVLGALSVAAGVAYTYFGGTADGDGIEQVASADNFYSEPILRAVEPADDANVGVSFQMLTAPVAPGANATFEIRTLPGAECDIVVEYANDVVSQDSGLIPKTANNYGMASWTWTVETTVPEGEWPIEVLCSRNEKSGMLRHDLEVGYEADE